MISFRHIVPMTLCALMATGLCVVLMVDLSIPMLMAFVAACAIVAMIGWRRVHALDLKIALEHLKEAGFKQVQPDRKGMRSDVVVVFGGKQRFELEAKKLTKIVKAVVRARTERPRIIRPPAPLLDAIARTIWSDKTYRRVFAPARADIIFEWQAAIVRGDHRAARRIKYVRGPWIMLWTMAWQVPWSLLKKVVEIVKSA